MDSNEGRMADRLDDASRVTVDQIDIPPEYRPTDLEAWLFTPGATRVGFMGDGGSRPPSGAPPSSGSSSSGPPPDELLKMLADRFERLEASIGHMETNLALGQVSAGHSSHSDVMHTVGEDGEIKTISLGNSDNETEGVDAIHAGPGLLDLYEAQSLALNPFLRSKDLEFNGPAVDPAKIVALILDNLSGSDAQLFIQSAAKSGFLNASEAKTLSGITSLAHPGEGSGNATLPNRPLLTFVAMVEAWRSQSSSSRTSSIASAPMVDFEPGE
ncbi:MAG: hypothetical protein CMB31_05535 [Euryarchaeota archaeon]|nr:hypothetical protein [Euryarchaeota archaeon]